MNTGGDISGGRDADFMRTAIELARRGLYTTDPNPRVGCVIVRDGDIVGRGWHARAGGPHAEINALAEAGERARGATIYVTLEPCAHHGRTGPCARALIDAGVASVYAADRDPNPQVAGSGLAMLSDAGIEVHCGLLADDARELNPGFLMRMARGRSFVRLKSAISLDARTALHNGESRWITGAAAREDVHRYRARASCIVTGIGTVLMDDPRLTVRLEDVAVLAPLVAVLDSRLRTPPEANIHQHPGGVVIFTREDMMDSPRADALRAAGAEVTGLEHGRHGVKPGAILDALGARQVNEVMVEAGPTLGGSFLREGLVDEWVVYMAPHLLGPDARALAELPLLESMSDRLTFAWQDVRRVGDDVRLILHPAPSARED